MSQDRLPEAEALAGELDSLLEISLEPSGQGLKNDGYAGRAEDKRSVQKDYFIASPAYHERVRDHIEEIKSLKESRDKAASRLREAMDSLQRGMEERAQEKRNVANYCDALFTGILTLEGRQIFYRETDILGLGQETTLSRISDAFPYGRIPFYQAYLSFASLDGEKKETIRKRANDRMDRQAPELAAAAKALKDSLSPAKLQGYAVIVEDYKEKTQILEFLKTMVGRFNAFCLENEIE